MKVNAMKIKALMKRKVFRIVLVLVICGVSAVLSISAFNKSDSAPVLENQVATVQRGDLTIDIAASGNLALSRIEDLTFEMSGTVEEILVEEGESVEEGQVLAKLDTSEWDKELTTLERDLLQAKISLENAKVALSNAEMAAVVDYWEVDIKEMQVELAKARLEDARTELEEALEASPEVTAPFDGFITKVNVSGGDEVKKGTVAVQLADPDEFEVDILVSEMDIFQVELGGKAVVQLDAVQGLSLPAEVTHISPTATIQQGVVNYNVKVELKPLETVMQEWQEARQEARENVVQRELPERLRQAIESGQITQEQADEIIAQMQQAQGEQQEQLPTTLPENFQLREGLTATVSVIVEERNDVLLVPNGAITTQGGQSYIQVISSTGTTEKRAIKTGITDYVNTEVTEGLSEGEKVVIPQGTITTTTTTQQGPQERIFIPGMGGGPPG
jgi:RND family efflux transporter MFP subunit